MPALARTARNLNCFVVSMYKLGDMLEGLDKLDNKNDESLHSCINFADERERELPDLENNWGEGSSKWVF